MLSWRRNTAVRSAGVSPAPLTYSEHHRLRRLPPTLVNSLFVRLP